MKQLTCLSHSRLQLAIIICGFFFTLISCSNKVDKTLDKFEGVIEKYEEKLEDKEFTIADRTEMYAALMEIMNELQLNGGNDESQWTPEQRVRAESIGARMEQIKKTARRSAYY